MHTASSMAINHYQFAEKQDTDPILSWLVLVRHCAALQTNMAIVVVAPRTVTINNSPTNDFALAYRQLVVVAAIVRHSHLGLVHLHARLR